MSQNNYYADTAFNSLKQKINQQPTTNASNYAFLEKSVLKFRVKGSGQQCCEFIATQDMYEIELLMIDEAPEKEYPIHEVFTWSTMKNPREILRSITHFCLFIAVVFIPATIFMGLFTSFNETILSLFYITIVAPLFIFFTGQYAIKKKWVTDKNNILFNRRTGLISFTWKGKRVTHPFHEFTVAMRHFIGRYTVHTNLFLYHSETGHFCMEPDGQTEEWKTEIEWEILQQYMDISQPLPDIPRMEYFRERDPFTKEWDIKNNRPPNYWRNTPLEEAFKKHEDSIIAAKNFPWGYTRKEAEQFGWQSSGTGDGDWR